MTMTMRTALLAGLMIGLLGCGPVQEEGPVAEPNDGAQEPTETTADLEGSLGGDAQLEGGCAWIEADDQRFEVLWPEGYRVAFEPLRLLGPNGEVVAEEGEVVRVTGAEDPDMMSICMVGPIFAADQVLTG